MTNKPTLTLLNPGPLYTPLDRACYAASLALVAGIDEDLTSGRRHYRNRAGALLTALDEVIRAILADDLVIGEASKVGEMTASDLRRIMRIVYIAHQRRQRERGAAKKAGAAKPTRVARVRRCKDCEAVLAGANIPRPRARICWDCIEARIRKETYRQQARWLTTSQRKELEQVASNPPA